MSRPDWSGDIDLHEPEAQAIEALWAGPLEADPLRLGSLTVLAEAERVDDGWTVRVAAYGGHDPESGARVWVPIDPPVELPERGAPEVALLRGQVEASALGWSDEAFTISQHRAAEEKIRKRDLEDAVREVERAIGEAL